MKIDEITENFELLDEWDDRYRYLIELGRTLPELPEAFGGPQFATIAGLAVASVAQDTGFGSYRDRGDAARGYFGRVGSWLKAGF